ncbi:LytTR family DNA-binding domain-containing protein [Rhizobium straminoryzae]|uniref:LytTR family transcriptional regulator n=1 Tax=Rhizobium straminoryzae TaxID=1387186 RepID=A0A549T9Q2_9HYPH|nr:LytTR family DNA-binding domain-containing protein [Rhizobium straminoryzae]TRL38604.1 LytTR family transcriptional regulator [Rhizobium straminoryzae]
MRERPEKYAGGSSLRLALREMQADLVSAKTHVLLAGAIIILSLSGPFGTYEALPPVGRLLYWATMVLLTFGLANFAGTLTSIALSRRGIRRQSALVPVGLAAGLAAGLGVTVIQNVVFGLGADPLRTLITIFGYALVIAMTITVILFVFRRADEAPQEKAQETTAAQPEMPPAPALAPAAALVRRLPLDKRGRIVSLTVRDHYVEVTTLKGKALLLMRLSDAIEEAGVVNGVQLHRSHWVAVDAIRAIHRVNGRLEVETLTDERLPVSRTHAARLRDAGLLP